MNSLDCKSFKEMLASGANNLTNKKDEIDRLNVFPVPDGDTGTNMNMTFGYGVKETLNYLNDNVGDTAKFLSKNMLMGARGNSGVILSQVFKGFAKAIEGKSCINSEELAAAFVNGARVAYKAVMRPVEGTILTVVRESSDYLNHYVKENPSCSIKDAIEHLTMQANASLQRTPELLPVLAEAGVVDSGGAGYLTILEGFNAYVNGKPITLITDYQKEESVEGYCVEINVDLNDEFAIEFSKPRLEKSLARTCDDIMVYRENNFISVHVHTNNPGAIVTTCQAFGDMKKVKVELLADKHEHILRYESLAKVEHTKYAIISVCNGEGVQEHFQKLGANYIINGGQTMNPSTEDFIKIIKEVNADHIFILPNNSNIIMAANQAKEMSKGLDVRVIPSKNIPEGISACINFNFEGDVSENEQTLNEAIKCINSVSITHAVKNTTFNSLEIHENDFMGLVGKEIIAVDKDMMNVIYKVIDSLDEDEVSYLTVIYGKETTKEVANTVLQYAVDKFDIEGEIIDGKQDLYPFIIGVE